MRNSALGIILIVSIVFMQANAVMITFTGGTVYMWDGTTGISNNANLFSNVHYYEENGIKFEYLNQPGAWCDIGDYYNVGNDVIHGHWTSMTGIKISKINGSPFDLTYFKVTSNTAYGGGPAQGTENVLINALPDGNTISYSQQIPSSNWGIQTNDPEVYLGAQFEQVLAVTITPGPGNQAFCFGLDQFYIDQPAPSQTPTCGGTATMQLRGDNFLTTYHVQNNIQGPANVLSHAPDTLQWANTYTASFNNIQNGDIIRVAVTNIGDVGAFKAILTYDTLTIKTKQGSSDFHINCALSTPFAGCTGNVANQTGNWAVTGAYGPDTLTGADWVWAFSNGSPYSGVIVFDFPIVCQDEIIVQTCPPGFTFVNGDCIENCFVAGIQTDTNCETCSQDNLHENCATCIAGFTLSGIHCCQNIQYCSAYDPDTCGCIQCDAPHTLIEGQCLCPSISYCASIDPVTCQCQDCNNPFLLQGNSCVCPQDTFLQNDSCSKCYWKVLPGVPGYEFWPSDMTYHKCVCNCYGAGNVLNEGLCYINGVSTGPKQFPYECEWVCTGNEATSSNGTMPVAQYNDRCVATPDCDTDCYDCAKTNKSQCTSCSPEQYMSSNNRCLCNSNNQEHVRGVCCPSGQNINLSTGFCHCPNGTPAIQNGETCPPTTTTGCPCQSIPGFEPWGAFCNLSASCSSQAACSVYAAFCQWVQG